MSNNKLEDVVKTLEVSSSIISAQKNSSEHEYVTIFINLSCIPSNHQKSSILYIRKCILILNALVFLWLYYKFLRKNNRAKQSRFSNSETQTEIVITSIPSNYASENNPIKIQFTTLDRNVLTRPALTGSRPLHEKAIWP